MTGFGVESDGRVQISDTGYETDFNKVVKRAKEFLARKLWRG